MDKKDFKNKATQAGRVIKDFARDTIIQRDNEFYNQGFNEGSAEQKKLDVKAAITAFLELKVKDHDIYKLLREYFDIDSISEASDCVFLAKKERQMRTLKKHFLNQGMSISDFYSYLKEHNLEERLSEDERLLEMSPEKLKAILDRD